MRDHLLLEHEFVAHLFAPLDGPRAALAVEQLATLWERLGTEVGISEAIPDVGLPTRFPRMPLPVGDGALAGAQDRRGDRQMVLRREHDVLNLSLALATPTAGGGPWSSLANCSPMSWDEFARWWDQLGTSGLNALLGAVSIFMAKAPRTCGDLTDWAPEVRADLPPHDRDTTGWWEAGRTIGSALAMWDLNSDRSIERRLAILADPADDLALSTFAWSDGSVALPPLARLLMHAARMRYQAELRGDGGSLVELRRRVEDRTNRIAEALRETGDPGSDLAGLVADEAGLENTLANLRLMRRVVMDELANLRDISTDALPEDIRLGTWLDRQLADDIEVLDTIARRARGIRELAGPAPAVTRAVPPTPSALAHRPPVPPPRRIAEVELRVGFGIDLVGYSQRTAPQQRDVQRRIRGLVELILDDLGVDLDETDRQEAGDGLLVMLPAGLELHRVLPRLLRGSHGHLNADNLRHTDQLSLRMSTALGQFARAAIGFAGQTIIEIGRLLDCDPLRHAVSPEADADFAVMVGDVFYEYVVGEGYSDLSANEFAPYEVVVKTYHRRAWLWCPTRNRGDERPMQSG